MRFAVEQLYAVYAAGATRTMYVLTSKAVASRGGGKRSDMHLRSPVKSKGGSALSPAPSGRGSISGACTGFRVKQQRRGDSVEISCAPPAKRNKIATRTKRSRGCDAPAYCGRGWTKTWPIAVSVWGGIFELSGFCYVCLSTGAALLLSKRQKIADIVGGARGTEWRRSSGDGDFLSRGGFPSSLIRTTHCKSKLAHDVDFRNNLTANHHFYRYVKLKGLEKAKIF